MMKTMIYFVIFFFPIFIKAQINLVYNASFEELSNCPWEGSQISFAKGWFSANNGTPDLYNACATNIAYVPPIIGTNFQYPKSGKGFSGIGTYRTVYGINDETEVIETKLKTKLEEQKKYWVYFHVNLSVSIMPCYADAIDLAFSKKIEKDSNKTILSRQKGVIHEKGRTIKDTAGWEKIAGVYRGNEEEYLLIGNFLKDSELTIDPTCFNSFPNGTYYFIDDVGVYEYDPLPDTLVLCKGQNKRMGGRFLDGTYHWNTGATDSIININKSGRYILTTTMDGKYELSDTMYVINPEDAVALLPRDTSFCKGELLVLTFPDIGTYQWNNGITNNILSAKASGLYSTIITTTCGTYQYAIDISEKDCNCNIFVPTAFSPHQQDGINDELRCYVQCGADFNILRFEVFDRWGNQVYAVENTAVEHVFWNGQFRGELLPQGIYTYSLEYEYVKKGKLIQDRKFGEFVLMQ